MNAGADGRKEGSEAKADAHGAEADASLTQEPVCACVQWVEGEDSSVAERPAGSPASARSQEAK
jgi:hypothetical protein